MPLQSFYHFDQDFAIAIWKMEEDLLSLETMASDIVGGTFHTEYADFTLAKRKREFLISRILLKVVLNKYGLEFHGIDKDLHNKPFLLVHPFPISITHSHDYAAVIMHKYRRVGIDLERVNPSIASVQDKFLTKDELRFFENDIQKLTLAWSAKESAFKLIGRKGLSLKKHIDLSIPNGGTMRGSIAYESSRLDVIVNYRTIEDYVLTFVTSP